MARAYFTDRACWMAHMRLDPDTGLDPVGIKLRAVTGLEAVDWFVPGYFVWGKVIESLGDVGYDPNSIHAATFDWRLSPDQLQKRDGYFTRLKSSIETLVAIHKVPVALLAHSYGDQLVRPCAFPKSKPPCLPIARP
jgi:phospholipid:diacylglycerol acyltransferase